MPTLHVRNVPEDLYARLKESADARHRSLSAEVIALLEWALEGSERNTASTLSSIQRRRSYSPAATGAPESVQLLREDRGR
jgi:plasmid stability protein